MIDGDLLIQGACTTKLYGPAVCTIEYTSLQSNDDSEQDLSAAASVTFSVPPWQMTLSPSTADERSATDEPTTFMIPISIESEAVKPGKVLVKVYVASIESLPYDSEDTDYDLDVSKFTLALSYEVDAVAEKSEDSEPESEEVIGDLVEATEPIAPATEELVVAEEGVAVADPEEGLSVKDAPLQSDTAANDTTDQAMNEPAGAVYAQDIKVATDEDDLAACKEEGYELQTVRISNDDVDYDMDSIWRFHILVKYAPIDQLQVDLEENDDVVRRCVVDVQWVVCTKGSGSEPVLEGYEVLGDSDLTAMDASVRAILPYSHV